MWLHVNGARRELGDVSTLADVLTEIEVPHKGVAVALDGEVVPRARWSATEVAEGARVEVVTAVQGG